MRPIKEAGKTYYTVLGTLVLASFVSLMFFGGSPGFSNETLQLLSFNNVASAATSSAVTVSATVATTVSCSTNIGSTAFGTLTSGSIATSTPNASTTVTTNDGAGATLSINDSGNGVNGGLSTSSPAYLIPSPAAGFPATSTLVAGTEGYGIQATSTAGGTGTFTYNTRYNVVGPFGVNAIGGLTTTTQTLASSTAAVTGVLVLVTHKAAISGSTQAATFADTITYTCTGN